MSAQPKPPRTARPTADPVAAAEVAADRVMALVELRPSPDALTLNSGHRVSTDGGDGLTIANAHGAVEVAIRFTAEGPVLHFPQGSVELATPDRVKLSCRSFDVHARESINLLSEGALHQTASDVAVDTSTLRLSAHEGNVDIEASRGDVDVRGEKILLNC